jgi:hypothetical protein
MTDREEFNDAFPMPEGLIKDSYYEVWVVARESQALKIAELERQLNEVTEFCRYG